MKNLLILILAIFLFSSCKKEKTQPNIVQTITSSPYIGKYICSTDATLHLYIVENNTTLYLDSLNGGYSPYVMLVTITGSSLIIPDKTTGYPMYNFYTKGSGVFNTTSQLTLDWTTDRSDYAPSWHVVNHLIYIKQ